MGLTDGLCCHAFNIAEARELCPVAFMAAWISRALGRGCSLSDSGPLAPPAAHVPAPLQAALSTPLQDAQRTVANTDGFLANTEVRLAWQLTWDASVF